MNIKALYRCTDCSHEQTVIEIHTEDGSVYVGSGANWCDECGDGLPKRVTPFGVDYGADTNERTN
jgi:predicted nucleic acid-binding Zn ribbon protein